LLVISGFCLPMARAQSSDRSAWLGVYTQSLTPELRDAVGHDGDGVLINRVVSRSPADLAGLRKGDILVRVNSESVNSPTELARSVQSHRPGDDVQLVVLRDGDRLRLTATLSSRSEEAPTPPPPPSWTERDSGDEEGRKSEKGRKGEDDGLFGRRVTPPTDLDIEIPDLSNLPDAPMLLGEGRARLGVRIETLNPDLAEYFEVKNGRGVLVLDVVDGSSADKVGIKAGDVIVMVDDRDVVDSDDLVKAIGEASDKVSVTVVRRGSRRTFEAELGSASPRVMRLHRGPGISGNRWRFDGNSRRMESGDREAYERELRELREELRQLKDDLKQLQEEGR
jgi:serine protease Do